MREVRDVSHKFFQLPYEEKMKIKMTRQSGYRCVRVTCPIYNVLMRSIIFLGVEALLKLNDRSFQRVSKARRECYQGKT